MSFYNYISVRDQVLIAKQKNKCDYKFDLPQNVIGLRIDDKTWKTKCSDPCTAGCCELFLYIIVNNTQPPRQVTIYYVKKAPIAYVTFIPSVLDFLKKQKILTTSKLVIVSDDLLPKKAPFKGKI